MFEWTRESLVQWSQAERHQLWLNAKKRGAEDLVNLIEASGLSYSDPAGLKLESPLGRAMARIVNSPLAKSAAIKATEAGLPALAGVDPLLLEELRNEYRSSYEATVQAGYLVAKMMRQAGFEQTGKQAALPDGCVAKTGSLYERR